MVPRIVMCGLDRLELLSGVILKLRALERLLTRYPGLRNKVVLVQVVLSHPGEGRAMRSYVNDLGGEDWVSEQYLRIREEVRSTVRRINTSFPGHVRS